MSADNVLAQLLGQAAARGVDPATLRAIVEEAGEVAATRALTRLGLADASAGRDLAELRELLGAWRAAKKSAWQALWGWVVRVASTVVLAGIAVRWGGEWVK
ncbi:MAG TPA: DUF6127 family protein [Sphingomonas sp.]|jgi:hypothetical protein|uniref:DUF6127 family protein n=1 Tax=Sphingomonas sp. TaxID=28214 RepID=UPI002ED8078C